MNDFKVLLGATLRALRTARHKTLAEVGDRAGMSLGFLSQVERGRNFPSVPALQKLAAALDLSLSQLFAQVEAAEPSKETP